MRDNLTSEARRAMQQRAEHEAEQAFKQAVLLSLCAVTAIVLILLAAYWLGTEQGQAFLDWFDGVSR